MLWALAAAKFRRPRLWAIWRGIMDETTSVGGDVHFESDEALLSVLCKLLLDMEPIGYHGYLEMLRAGTK